MNPVQSEVESHRLIAGVLCLDFANTLNGHKLPAAGHEYLKDYSDLAAWCRRTAALTADEADLLLKEAALHPKKAAAAYRQAIDLRETLYRLFAALALGQRAAAADLARLNQARSEALEHSQIAPAAEGYRLEMSGRHNLQRMLWPLALSAADLLTSAKAGQIRQCAGQGCDWLFVDTSRNHLRRWCSMDECGNRSKSRRFSEHSRKQIAAAEEAPDTDAALS
ncbi:MAG: ABATE domain-containing protein [Anaerolineaceae bacterium]|nr:ABATE domain-containing protein [Anaerolineaceae bacterium]